MATPKGWYATSLIGGGADALDAIDGDDLTDKDVGYVAIVGTALFYQYTLDDDSGAAEDSPDVIAPDTNPGNKRWILLQDGGSAMKTVQRGQKALASLDATDTVTITAVVMAKSFLIFSFSVTGSTTGRNLMGDITNTTTLTFTRGQGEAIELLIEWQVVEFY